MTSYSSIILDYLGADVAANRPVSLNIAPTALGLYTATDTGIVSAWYGAAWHVVATEGASVSEIVAGAGLSGGTITTSGTIALDAIAAGDLLGNPGSVAAVPSAVAIGSGLSLSALGTLSASGGVASVVAGSGLSGGTITTSGTIALGTIAAGDLLGNPGTAAAVPSAVALGAGLTLSAGGTLTAGGGSGSVTSVVAGSGLSGGTITSTGTIALGTIAAGDLLGNPGTAAAVPSAVAVGSGLSLSALGTLSATGGGTVTNIATTGGISGGPITSTGTLATDWNGGTVTLVGNGLTIDAGHTLQAVKNSRTVSTGFTLAATDSDSLIISNNATANVTITAPSSLGTGFNVELFNQNVGTLVVVPGAGTTLNGGGSTVFPLPIFTSTELVIDATGTNYSAVPGLSFWNPNAGLVTALGTGLVLSGGTLSASAAVAQPINPSSIFLADNNGITGVGFHPGAGGNASPHDYGVQVIGSPGVDATVEMRFPMPHVIPAGTLKLRIWGLFQAAGVAKMTVKDGAVSAGASPSAVSLTSETQTSITSAGVDLYNQAKVALTTVPTADQMLVLAVTFNFSGWTTTGITTWLFAAIWE